MLRLLEQGPESQSASSVCWGGVLSVMGSSELDAPSFVPPWHKVIGIKAHCLDGLNTRLLGWLAQSTTPLAFSILSQVGMGASSPVATCDDVTGLLQGLAVGLRISSLVQILRPALDRVFPSSLLWELA